MFFINPFLGTTQTYKDMVLDDGAIGLWMLDETSGSTANDSTTNGLDATLYNTPTLDKSGPSAAFLPKAMGFAGASSENARTNTSATLQYNSSGAWSAELWFRDNATGNSTIESLMTWRGEVGIAGDTLALFTVNNGSAGRVQVLTAAPGPPNDGTLLILTYDRSADTNWHHLAATAASGGTLRFYLDGAEVATSTATRWSGTNYIKRVVMAANWDITEPIQYTTGDLAAVAVYATELTAAQVLAHYQKGANV